MSQRENIVRIKVVYNALEELAKNFVFVGGATVSLYADRPAVEIRPTEDVDILVELLNYNDYAAVEVQLRSKGFINDVDSGVICRYKVQGVTVDVMPTGGALGFTNQWYEEGYKTAMDYNLENGYYIKIFQPVYFLASKMAAFNNRGGGDGRGSTDFEDIIYLLNNRTTIWKELREAVGDIAVYLKKQFGGLLENPYIDEWISGNLEQNEQQRTITIIGELNSFAKE
jgi:predicted nucleotidyltransferase